MGLKGVIPSPLSLGNNNKLAMRNSRIAPVNRVTVRNVMASPPTVTWSTTNTITGRFWPAANAGPGGTAGIVSSPYFTFTRCGSILTGQASMATKTYVYGTSVNYNSVQSFNVMGVSFIHTGTQFAIYMGGYSERILIKVDDQYVTMTPHNFANDGSLNYGSVVFATAGRRRIELLISSGTNPPFGGVYTDAGDAIQPANVRGPRVIMVGDSFCEGSNAASGPCSNYPVVFSELMGWDDVWTSGVGGTGFLNAGVGHLTYRQRLATDVFPYNPDIVFVQGSTNDGSSTDAAVGAEALLTFQAIQAALPKTLICAFGPTLNVGVAYANQNTVKQRATIKAAVQAVGGLFIDIQQMPVSALTTPQVTTLNSGYSSGVTTIQTVAPLVPGTTYQFADGSCLACATVSGSGSPFTANIDKLTNSQSGGATMTQVGSCLWTGNGNVSSPAGNGNCDTLVSSDTLHPTQFGHEALAEAICYGFLNQMFSN